MFSRMPFALFPQNHFQLYARLVSLLWDSPSISSQRASLATTRTARRGSCNEVLQEAPLPGLQESWILDYAACKISSRPASAATCANDSLESGIWEDRIASALRTSLVIFTICVESRWTRSMLSPETSEVCADFFSIADTSISSALKVASSRSAWDVSKVSKRVLGPRSASPNRFSISKSLAKWLAVLPRLGCSFQGVAHQVEVPKRACPIPG